MYRIAKLMFLTGMLATLCSLTLTQIGCGSGSGSSSSSNTQTTQSTGGSTDNTGGGGTTPTPPVVTPPVVTPPAGPTPLPGIGTINVVQNIVFFLEENRSFDSYFGMLNAYQKTVKGIANPQVEALPLNVILKDLSGNPIKPFHIQTACTDAITPAWGASITQYASGKLTGFMRTLPHRPDDPDGTRAMGYYDWTDLPYYYELATQYATSDRQFASVGARTPVNRMYIFGASSYGNIDFGPVPQSAPTIFDRLTAAKITWKHYYLPSILPQNLNINAFHTSKTDPDKIVPIDQYFTDLQNGTLPQVSFIETDGSGFDEHPQDNVQVGAVHISQIINSFISSSYYATGVVLMSYDEHGGLYDHVKPITVAAPDNIPPNTSEDPGAAPGDFTRAGFRVPLMVVSPWVKPGYVSHVPRENTSMLKFIETRFNLQPLTKRDASQDDMTEMFDFTTPALATPPQLPVQLTNRPCSFTLEVSPMPP
jgi:phospholipase C